MSSYNVVYHINRLLKTLSETVSLTFVVHFENTLSCDIALEPNIESIVSRILFHYCVRDLSKYTRRVLEFILFRFVSY